MQHALARGRTRRPRDPAAEAAQLALVARAQCERGELAKAALTYEEAIIADPRCAHAIEAHRALLVILAAPARVLETYGEAIEATRGHVELHVARGHLRLHVGDPAGALSDYSLAIGRAPGRADFYVFRGRAREALGDIGGAIADYREAQRVGRPTDDTVPDAALRAVRLEIELSSP